MVSSIYSLLPQCQSREWPTSSTTWRQKEPTWVRPQSSFLSLLCLLYLTLEFIPLCRIYFRYISESCGAKTSQWVCVFNVDCNINSPIFIIYQTRRIFFFKWLQEIFCCLQDSWASELLSSLGEFLSEALNSSSKPRLYEIYQAGTSEQGRIRNCLLDFN